jgi:chemosensory pili system protein ChpA (sensor histidine kinase/response regulator)
MIREARPGHETLGWVKKELDAILEQARRAFESYIDHQDDASLLPQAQELLRQVSGTLQMVELYGAAILAREMEEVTQALIDKTIRSPDDAFEVLLRAILQLPDYLEHIEAGNRDVPVVLLPLLNDLRTARDASLMSEKVLFFPDAPDISAADADGQRPAPDPNLAELARRLRHHYQLGLLSWFRGQDARGGLEKLKNVALKLRDASGEPACRRLWWSAAALAEAVSVGALEASVTVKSLLGKMDREIKRLSDHGEGQFAAALPAELVKNILYYVAYADDRSALVREVKQAYGLAGLLPQGRSLRAARERPDGPSAAAMSTVSQALDDLNRAKDTLESFAGAPERDAAQLEPLVPQLRTIADTLSMLGVTQLAHRIMDQAATVSSALSDQAEIMESALMQLAGVILDAEIAIDNLALRDESQPLAHDPATPAESAIAAGEHRRLVAAVVVESLRDLERVKEAIAGFIAAPTKRSGLAELPGILEHIHGAVAMAHVTQAPTLLMAISAYISARLLPAENLPNGDELNTLADAITSVEYILEAASQGRPAPAAALEIGRASIARLGYPSDALAMMVESYGAGDSVPFDPIEADPPAWRQIHSAFEALATDRTSKPGRAAHAQPLQGPEVSEHETAPSSANLPPQEPEPTMSVPPARASQQRIEPPSKAASAEFARLVPLTGQADAEILQIFIEEAEEAAATIKDLLPKWLAATDDQEALTTVRRSFHTLKGSGRLVGAQMLGEFAWALEHLLNRVLDGTVIPSTQMADLLHQAPSALAELIAQIKGEGAPKLDVPALMTAAHALSQRDTSAAKPGAAATMPASAPADNRQSSSSEAGPIARLDEPGLADPESAASPESIVLPANSGAAENAGAQPDPEFTDADPTRDPALLNIFINEAQQHLKVLDAAFAVTHGEQELPVTDDLLRALHTLAGSARTAQVPQIARLCAPLEQFAAARAAASQPIPIESARLLAETIEAVREIVASLENSARPLPSHSRLLEDIECTLHDELARCAAVLRPASQDHAVDARMGDVNAEDVVGVVDRSSQEAASMTTRWRTPIAPETGDNAPVDLSEANDFSAVQDRQTQSVSFADEAELGLPQDRELVEIFIEEARDLMYAADNSVRQWRDDPGNGAAISDLQRYLHTLKGGARMAGCIPVADLSHALESMIAALVDARGSPSALMFDAMHRAFDRLHDMLAQLEQRQVVTPAAELVALISGLRPDAASTSGDVPPTDPAANAEREAEPSTFAVEDPQEHMSKPKLAAQQVMSSAPAASVSSRTGTPAEQIRMGAELLDKLVNGAGEVNIYHARLEQQITGFKFNLRELEQTVARLRDQLRKLEMETEAQILFRYEQEKGALDEAFDPLELDRYSTMQQLSRALGESVSDLVSIKEILLDQVRGSETLLLQQSRVSTDLQESLMRARMVQFSGLAPRLRRVVRQTAQELGRKVKLDISGENHELDRSMLARMMAPLEHMLRNAVSHGIEAPDERRARGKPEEGSIRLSLAREGSEIVIKVEDDGAGIDLEAVRRKACALGMMRDGDQLPGHDVMQFILEPGFSTAAQVTQISGRGVGMDVVKSEITQLSGVLGIDSVQRQGTTFTIRLPFTLAINQALLVQSADEIYAVPLTSIEGVVRLSAGELQQLYAQPRPSYEYAANVYELRHLGALLGRAQPVLGEPHMMYPLMLVRSGERRVALQIDGLLGNREVVVKPVGPQISKVKGISGATILGDGRVVLILDLASLVRTRGVHLAYSAAAPVPEVKREKLRSVMVVDDSITIRKVTSRMLERHNFAVSTAKDGVDAVSQLQDHVPDLFLLDIEMPRMDGYELATYIRNTAPLREIPIIMITSRAGEKHRQRAIEIGVNRYLGKPYQETELLDHIQELLAGRSL